MGNFRGHYLFFSDHINDTTALLVESEAQHAIKALRIRVGDTLDITDGKGRRYSCTVVHVGRREVACRIEGTMRFERESPQVHLYVGLPSRNAFERVVELVVPLGIDTITPLLCARSEPNWWEKKHKQISARMRQKAIAGMTQSLQVWETTIHAPLTLAQMLRCVSGNARLVAGFANAPSLSNVAATLTGCNQLIGLVGPPGGFTGEEADAFEHSNGVSVRLSAHRLRTELAASVLCASLRQMVPADPDGGELCRDREE